MNILKMYFETTSTMRDSLWCRLLKVTIFSEVLEVKAEEWKQVYAGKKHSVPPGSLHTRTKSLWN